MTTTDNKKRLGELVTEAYKAVGNTRQGMAPLVGVSERSMYMIENGLSIPRAHTQRKLEEVLGWRRGAIADVLGLGPDAELSKVPLSFMQESKNSAWADLPNESAADVIQRLTSAATDAALMLREKERQEQEHLRRIHELEQQVAALQSGFGLAADDSPN
ncbi:hypothetical protein ACFFON_02345 [Arthrobacter citreus]|uniref:helix-turn-helix domain-containing protein n=1 Tax=Arthrobacter TaxID=1663 RepID=UPI0012642ADF|nr:helix-turn-helix domain-containing protein [Arthrobacter gandavensis]